MARQARLLSVVVPTYNEAKNIKTLVKKVFGALEALRPYGIEGEVVIIDDNSPDGTADIAKNLAKGIPEIKVVVRKGERGLSSAILKGFKIAKGDILLVMDADLSHPPKLIPDLVTPIVKGKCDMTIASRYMRGGGTEDWPMKRRVVSWGATVLAHLVTPVKDPMSGFFALRRSVIEGVRLDPKGYKIGFEILGRGNYKKVLEVPYKFKDRKAGKSKMSGQIMTTYVGHLAGLLFAPRSIFRQFVKFCLVGLLGTLVNLAVLYASVEWAHVWYIIGATLAFCVAVTFNYALNKVWTFGDRTGSGGYVVGAYLKFIAVSLVGLALNLGILYLLTERMHLWYILSQVIAILAASVLNFLGSRWVVFTKART
jgi:dolichol-phosphate mannosyltransferase